MIGRYEGSGGSAAGGMLYCCVGSDGMVRGCPDQAERYGEGGDFFGDFLYGSVLISGENSSRIWDKGRCGSLHCL